MKKLFTLLLAAALFSANANAQLFQNVIGKVDVSESARSVTQSTDSSYLLAGSFYTSNATKSQEFVTHLKKNGSVDWSRKISVSGLSNAFWLISSHAEAVKKNNGKPDGYIMLIDETETISQDPDCYLVRLNNNGSIAWARHLTYVSGKKVRPSYDATGGLTGFIILADAFAGAVILKTDATGNQLWQKRIASNVSGGQYRFEDLQATADGGCITAGNLYINYELAQPALFKMNAAGNVTWGHHYVLNTNSEGPPSIHGVTITNTGYALTGYNINESKGNTNITFATNTTGAITWAFKYLHTNSPYIPLPGSSIAADATGNLVVTTSQLDNSSEEDAVIFKLNSAGTVLFAKSFDGSNGLREIKVTNKNTYCAVGSAQPGPNQDMFVTNISSSGSNQSGCQPVSLTLTTIATYTKTTQNAAYSVLLAASANTAATATSTSIQTEQALCNTLDAKQITTETSSNKLQVGNDVSGQRIILKWQTNKPSSTPYEAVLFNFFGKPVSTIRLSANAPGFILMNKMQAGIYSIALKQNSEIIAQEKVIWSK